MKAGRAAACRRTPAADGRAGPEDTLEIGAGATGSTRARTRRLQPVHECPFIEAELSFGAAGRGHACREADPNDSQDTGQS